MNFYENIHMTKDYSINIENEKILFADLTNRNDLELIVVCESGKVYFFDLIETSYKFLLKLNFEIENLKLHSFESYICIIQEIGTSGVVLNLSDKNFLKELSRVDYHANICPFSIAFYKKEGQTFIIHATEWNRLDITCLNDNKKLTERIVDYETNQNYFDYFQCSLLMSPNQKYFISSGWYWNPVDRITCYSVDRFLKEFEKCYSELYFGDTSGNNWSGRPLCWIDDTTIAIGYNQQEDKYEKKFSSEIIILNVESNTILKKVFFDGFAVFDISGDVYGELYYDELNENFIGINNDSGLLISNKKGEIVYKDSRLKKYKFSTKHKVFYQIEYEKQSIRIIDLKSVYFP